jgi:proteic killer suppression protein
VIVSFGDDATADLFHGRNTARVRHLPGNIVRIIRRKLDMVNAAHVLHDLAVPPNNHLAALKGDLAGWHSIRVNQQWRILFKWNQGAHEVRLIDYH